MKTKIEIKHRFTGDVLFSFECESIKECVIEAVKTGANLTRANLTGADLTRADLTEANLTGADLTRANLAGADLTGANLTGANLTGADLTGADLTEANLTEANLTRANLTGADLTRANLAGADLTGANLTRANLDMSAFPLRCSSLKIKTNKRLRVQLCFHFLSLIKHGIEVTDEEKKIFEDLKTYANQFHRTDVERL